jgi:hypothetical protein
MAIVKRFKKNRARRNPDDSPPAPSRSSSSASTISDLFAYVGPGFAGFAATRFATRIASTQIATRWPAWAKHAGAVASVGSFLAAWQLAHRVRMLEKYSEPIAVGSGIAAIQSIIQLYIPRLGWVVSDATPEIDATAATSAAPATSSSAPVATSDFDQNFEILDEVTGSWRAGRDAGDPGRYARPIQQNNVRKSNAINDATIATADDPLFDYMDDASDFANVGGSLAQ